LALLGAACAYPPKMTLPIDRFIASTMIYRAKEGRGDEKKGKRERERRRAREREREIEVKRDRSLSLSIRRSSCLTLVRIAPEQPINDPTTKHKSFCSMMPSPQSTKNGQQEEKKRAKPEKKKKRPSATNAHPL